MQWTRSIHIFCDFTAFLYRCFLPQCRPQFILFKENPNKPFKLLKPYILKAKKFAEPLFQSKKIAEKVRKSGRHFWAIWGNCGPFWVIFGPLWIILGHSRAIWGHLGSYLGHFGPCWVIFGPNCGKFNFFARLFGSRYSLLECKFLPSKKYVYSESTKIT